MRQSLNGRLVNSCRRGTHGAGLKIGCSLPCGCVDGRVALSTYIIFWATSGEAIGWGVAGAVRDGVGCTDRGDRLAERGGAHGAIEEGGRMTRFVGPVGEQAETPLFARAFVRGGRGVGFVDRVGRCCEPGWVRDRRGRWRNRTVRCTRASGRALMGDDWTKGSSGNGVFKAHVGAGTAMRPRAARAVTARKSITATQSGRRRSSATGTAIPSSRPFPSRTSSARRERRRMPPGRSSRAMCARRTTSRTRTSIRSWPISPCTTGSGATDTMLYLGGHVGDNEGDHFWGFKFRQEPSDQLRPAGGKQRGLVHARFQPVDLRHLVVFHGPGSSSDPVVIEASRLPASTPTAARSSRWPRRSPAARPLSRRG